MLTHKKVKGEVIIFRSSEKNNLTGFFFRKLPKNAIKTTKNKPYFRIICRHEKGGREINHAEAPNPQADIPEF